MRKRTIFTPWFFIAALCLLGLLTALVPGYRFTGFVLWSAALVVLFYQLLGLLERKKPVTAKRLRNIFTILLCLFLLAYAFTGAIIIGTGYITYERECSHLIVLGAGVNGTAPSLSLRERLDAAAAYLQAHPNATCIVSGGQGRGEDITEAECMFRYLTAAGIDPQRIIKEDRATSTEENLAYSMALIDEVHRSSIGIVSSEYHLYRAGLMARDLGLDPILIPARTTWLSLRMNYYMREVAAVWYYMILGGQQHDFSFLCGPGMGICP